MTWSNMKHQYTTNAYLNSSLYYLEMLSKKDEVQIVKRLPLNKNVVRIGTLIEACGDSTATLSGLAKQNTMISKIHCLIYCPMGANHDRGIIIIDNNSKYGTYVVTEKGAKKVPTKISNGLKLESGNLLCIGVKENGQNTLTPTEAGSACIVYRVCIDTPVFTE